MAVLRSPWFRAFMALALFPGPIALGLGIGAWWALIATGGSVVLIVLAAGMLSPD
ncbi:hypothetical protein [Prescottella equi]|uniref:hypothetical protein n=1 Tax=Rhodococcus hoagii TaxID=43767 RepID=UPI0015858C6D|nr:hypothetical protein [Prescottella equi]